MTQSEHISNKEAAAILHMTPEALNTARCRRVDWLPPHYKRGRLVFYKRDEVIACFKLIAEPSNKYFRANLRQ
jgi:hypothetical protein